MSQRYGTRSTTKAVHSRAPIVGNPPASEQSSSLAAAVPAGSSRHNPGAAAAAAAAEEAPQPCTNGRGPLTAPPSPFVRLAVGVGEQRRQEPTPTTLMLPAKRAIVAPSGAPASVLVPSTAGAAQIGEESHPPRGGESRRKRSRLSLSRRRASSPQQVVVAPAVFAPTGDSKSGGSCAVVGCFPGGISPRLSEGGVGSARRSPRKSPPPPFVGLKNVGETCYVNTVLQSLAACRTALESSRGASGAAAGDGGTVEDRQKAYEGWGSSPAAPVRTADDAEISSVHTVLTGVRSGTDGNPVFFALGKVLGEMDARNRTLFQQQWPELPVELSTGPEISSLTGGGSPEMPVHPSGRTPLRLDVPARQDVCAGAIAPNALVELIREGWLSAERATGGATAGLVRRLGRGGSPAVGDFGNGQACVSELLGKLLDVGAATAAAAAAAGVVHGGGELGDASSGSVGDLGSFDNSGVCSLAAAFRGTLCARTHCVECERERISREEFTELTLPPLVLPLQPLAQPHFSPRLAAAQGAEAVDNDTGDLSKLPPQETQTLQSLVDVMLGRESLEGNNKVWCEACRQWNEAERRSSICSPPSLLALHVRPGSRKQSSRCPYPAAAVVAAGGALKKQVDGAGGAGGKGGPRKTEQGLTAHGGVIDNNRELVERVLVVKSAARCPPHVAGASGNGPASSAPVCQLQQPRDVFYDLVGVILHQGQTLGSGHYTFALHAGGPAYRFGDQAPTSQPHPPPAGDESSASGGTEHSAASAEEADRENPGSVLVQGLVGEGEAGGSVAGGTSYTRPAFALFDDDVVRWLSLKEESAVLRGGGGAIGDPFLVFYARRK